MSEQPILTDGFVSLRPDGQEPGRFEIEVEGDSVGELILRRGETGAGALVWSLHAAHRRRGYATRAVRLLLDQSLRPADEGGGGLTRVEAVVPAEAQAAMRVATRSGMRREGVRRVVTPEGADSDQVVLARLATDPDLSEPGAFRALLNSFLPRKRAIAQMLVRDTAGRVLVCALTYKSDWDLPGGVVEVGESPRTAVGREVVEELALTIEPGRLLLTDWLPPWGGWDDAVCLVFDGGVHEPDLLAQVVEQAREIRSAQWCDASQVRAHCADFTARRIEAALASLAGTGPAYTESGRA